MYFGLVYYPPIDHQGFHDFRKKYEPYHALLSAHVTFIFPVPATIGRNKLEKHIKEIVSDWKPFDAHFCTVEKTWDHWMYLFAKQGHNSIIELHDQLYEGMLKPYLRKDLPFYPHIGLGLFSKENYDFDNPTANLSLDNVKYEQARKEFEKLKFDLWCTIDKLTLVAINAEYSECRNLSEFEIGG